MDGHSSIAHHRRWILTSETTVGCEDTDASFVGALPRF